MENVSILAIFGFCIILLGTLIYFLFTKKVSHRKIIFFSFFLIILGMLAIMICLNHYLTLNQISKFKQEIDSIQCVHHDEIDYSIMEKDSLTGETIYRECSIDTFVP